MTSLDNVSQIDYDFPLNCCASSEILRNYSTLLFVSRVFVLPIKTQCFVSIVTLIGLEVWLSFFPFTLF